MLCITHGCKKQATHRNLELQLVACGEHQLIYVDSFREYRDYYYRFAVDFASDETLRRCHIDREKLIEMDPLDIPAQFRNIQIVIVKKPQPLCNIYGCRSYSLYRTQSKFPSCCFTHLYGGFKYHKVSTCGVAGCFRLSYTDGKCNIHSGRTPCKLCNDSKSDHICKRCQWHFEFNSIHVYNLSLICAMEKYHKTVQNYYEDGFLILAYEGVVIHILFADGITIELIKEQQKNNSLLVINLTYYTEVNLLLTAAVDAILKIFDKKASVIYLPFDATGETICMACGEYGHRPSECKNI